jgi:hypothetical protein
VIKISFLSKCVAINSKGSLGDMARQAHLIGSIGLSDANTVFNTVNETLGDYCSRIPDGETGDRSYWIRWQDRTFANNTQLEAKALKVKIPGFKDTMERTFYSLKAGVNPRDLDFGVLGYADAALNSWALFSKLQDEGKIRAHVRFLVSLPTPVALLSGFVMMEDRAACEPAMEAAMLADLDRIQKSIPSDHLSVQWDVCFEVVGAEAGPPLHYDDVIAGSAERLRRLCGAVAPEVELGIHLCYGDPGHKHIVEPDSLEVSVAFASAICSASPRDVNFMHMPVPRSRADEAYFAPLDDLDMPDVTRLILGLVHHTDGVEGTRQRMSVANKFVFDFDVATECGFGRRNPDTIQELLNIHRDICS